MEDRQSPVTHIKSPATGIVCDAVNPDLSTFYAKHREVAVQLVQTDLEDTVSDTIARLARRRIEHFNPSKRISEGEPLGDRVVADHAVSMARV